jgi:hypothetical protein
MSELNFDDLQQTLTALKATPEYQAVLKFNENITQMAEDLKNAFVSIQEQVRKDFGPWLREIGDTYAEADQMKLKMYYQLTYGWQIMRMRKKSKRV